MNALKRQLQSFWRTKRAWLGYEQPVPQAVAEARSLTCLTCPLHDASRPVEEAAKRLIVNTLLNVKSELGLKVEREADLHLCGFCGCVLSTKVWEPLQLARDNTPDWQAMPDHCWMKTSNEQTEDIR